MTTVRFVSCPARLPGETGRAFVDRMLAELSAKQGATSPLVYPPKPIVQIEAPNGPSRDRSPGRHRPDGRRPSPKPSTEGLANATPSPSPSPTPRTRKTAKPSSDGVVIGFDGKPDTRPTTRKWPPPYDPVTRRSSHRYVGHWPPRWLTPSCSAKDIEANQRAWKARAEEAAKAAHKP